VVGVSSVPVPPGIGRPGVVAGRSLRCAGPVGPPFPAVRCAGLAGCPAAGWPLGGRGSGRLARLRSGTL